MRSALVNLPVSTYRCPRLLRTVDSDVPEIAPNRLTQSSAVLECKVRVEELNAESIDFTEAVGATRSGVLRVMTMRFLGDVELGRLPILGF